MIRPIAKFGTYGFMCSLVAMQMSVVSMANSDASGEADRAMSGDSASDAEKTKGELNHVKKSAK
jgi:hypothetical protein